MMEENERGRARGLPLDALEGRIEALQRRAAIKLTVPERTSLLELLRDADRDGADRGNTESLLLSWFTRREIEAQTPREQAIRRAEAYVAYLLDVSAQGEAKAFETLAESLAQAGESA